MDVRILGVAPVVYTIDPNTNAVLGTRTLFWLYFPEIQYVLQNHFVFNRMNDAQRMSFNDLFVKRMFSSYIKKESNICDRKITDYVAGVDALLEAERVKNDISQMEHDVWDI
jgi:gliding motility associated protien GldN